MFDHVTIRVSDRAASERFYTTVLGTLGVEPTYAGDDFVEWANDFSIGAADAEHPVTRGLRIAWFAPTREDVQAFWQAGIDAGYRDDGAPGPRPEYGPDYYGGFLLDPDGNSAEAVKLDKSVAPHAAFRLSDDTPERVQFRFHDGSFSLVAGPPTEHVHLAFAAPGNATVDAFHGTATEAGYRDNGPPGERGAYHPGYYGAHVLDPDGNNVEAVSRSR